MTGSAGLRCFDCTWLFGHGPGLLHLADWPTDLPPALDLHMTLLHSSRFELDKTLL